MQVLKKLDDANGIEVHFDFLNASKEELKIFSKAIPEHNLILVKNIQPDKTKLTKQIHKIGKKYKIHKNTKKNTKLIKVHTKKNNKKLIKTPKKNYKTHKNTKNSGKAPDPLFGTHKQVPLGRSHQSEVTTLEVPCRC